MNSKKELNKQIVVLFNDTLDHQNVLRVEYAERRPYCHKISWIMYYVIDSYS